MSRTYRRAFVHLDRNDKPYAPRSRGWWADGKYWWESPQHCDFYSKWNQRFDKKSYHKATHEFKKMMNRRRRARENAKMKKMDYDNVPIFRTENDWHWD